MDENGDANVGGDVKGDKAEYTRQGTYQEPPILKVIEERFEELEDGHRDCSGLLALFYWSNCVP